MIKAIAKLIVALNGNVKKTQLAAGFSWGILLGLVPAFNFFWIVLIGASFFFKHNHASKLITMLIVKLLSPLLGQWVDILGWELLNHEALRPFFTALYNTPFVPFTRFNNTLVAGGLAGGFVLWLPVFFLGIGLVSLYRNTLGPALGKLGIFRIIAKIPFVERLSRLLTGESRGK